MAAKRLTSTYSEIREVALKSNKLTPVQKVLLPKCHMINNLQQYMQTFNV